MNRSIHIQQDFLLGSAEVVVELSDADVVTFAMELTLLLHAMTTTVTLRCPNGAKVDITLGSNDKWAVVDRLSTSRVCFHLGRNQAEYIHAVLLRAYLNKAAEVNHIHVEGDCRGETVDLTILFQTYVPSMTPDEVAARTAN